MVLDTVNIFVNDDALFCIVGNFNTSNDNDSVIWHARLGDIEQDRLKRLAQVGLLGSLAKVKLPICKHCLVGKATRLSFDKAKRATNKLQFIHSDICGPMNVRARHGANYFITFIDDFTRFGHVYLTSHKTEALDCFTQFTRLVENQLSPEIKTLRSDQRHEYPFEQFKGFCDEKGIARHLTISYTPQQNA